MMKEIFYIQTYWEAKQTNIKIKNKQSDRHEKQTTKDQATEGCPSVLPQMEGAF